MLQKSVAFPCLRLGQRPPGRVVGVPCRQIAALADGQGLSAGVDGVGPPERDPVAVCAASSLGEVLCTSLP